MKNIGFISTRIAGTDGVSHEIEKWARVLEADGYRCFYCAGDADRAPELCRIIEEAHFRHPEIARINGAVFGKTLRTEETTRLIHAMTAHLKQKLARFLSDFGIDCIIAENALTIPMNVPLGIALTELIAETGIPTVAHHHDFAWERERFLVNAVGDYLQMSFPPALPAIRHVVINSLARESLAYRRGVPCAVVPNTFDFGTPPGPDDPEVIARVRREAGVGPGELFVLQPTRVVPRKCIERSIDLVSGLAGAARRLVISHPSGDEGEDYLRRLQEYADMRKVRLVFIEGSVSPDRSASNGRPYTIGDVYRAADLVTYPSAYEGFGNALLEAVYFRKPLVVNRYPVFIADIEPLGFDLCLIDGFITGGTIRRIEETLADTEKLRLMADRNFGIAAKHFSFEKLDELLQSVMEDLKRLSPA